MHQRCSFVLTSMVKKSKQNNQEHTEDMRQKRNEGISIESVWNEALADANVEQRPFWFPVFTAVESPHYWHENPVLTAQAREILRREMNRRLYDQRMERQDELEK